jgi:hypothetical protein
LARLTTLPSLWLSTIALIRKHVLTSSKKLKEKWLGLIQEYGSLAILDEMWVTHFNSFHMAVFMLSPGLADYPDYWVFPYPTYSANFLRLAGYLVSLPNGDVHDLWYSGKISRLSDQELFDLWKSLYDTM